MLSLQIIGDAIEGTKLSVEKRYWGGEEGDSVFRWFRVILFTFVLIIYIFGELQLGRVIGMQFYLVKCERSA